MYVWHILMPKKKVIADFSNASWKEI